MRPRNLEGLGDQGDLFRAQLSQILNRNHPLYVLGNQMDWSIFEQEFGPLYVEHFGRPGLPIRLVVGLHYLKYAYNESDESVVERFLENPYWQYFCGFEYFEHEVPLDPSSLVRWRRRVGSEGMEVLSDYLLSGYCKGFVSLVSPSHFDMNEVFCFTCLYVT